MAIEDGFSVLSILWRSGLAALLGLIIGWERRTTGSLLQARIIALVAMTATALTALSMQMAVSELTRLLAGLLTGVGFIGGGVIMRNGTGDVRGLTTAAALWAMTAVAIVIGVGFTFLGLLLTLLVYTVLSWDEWPILARLRGRWTHRTGCESPKETI